MVGIKKTKKEILLSDNSNIGFHQGIVDTDPEEVGYNPERLKQLDSHLLELIVDEKLQCASYLLSRYGKTFACKSVGKLNYHKNSPDFMPDSIRKIASITKIFTSMAIMKLIEDGKLYLEQPVSTIIKEFDTDMHRLITIFHLLTHTSGLRPDPGVHCEPYPSSWWDELGDAYKNNKEINWIEKCLAGPVEAKPAEMWLYSTLGFVFLGEIVTRVSGVHCEQFIVDNITIPLEMNETFFSVPEKFHRRVCCTERWNEEILKDKSDTSKKPPRTGGGLHSTLYDLNKLGQMFLNVGEYNGRRILCRKAIETMITNQLSGIDTQAWGKSYKNIQMGLGINRSLSDLLTPGTYSHEGAGRCVLYIDPAESLVVSFFVPTIIEWVPESIINTKSIIWSGLT
ncbi:MAG: beta-lactamase family protein [Actinomycetia bacterium]|nr:beta-lactamase family protein [Actinomycetes bacterium]